VGVNEPDAGSTGFRRVLGVNDLPGSAELTVDLQVPARALAVGAHPDDIEFGCGATLAKWAAGGCEIHHLVLTDGAKGTWDPASDPASLVAQRQDEQREAARLLGGREVGFLGFPDGELRNGVREQWEVCRWIRLVRPTVVLGHDPWRRYRLHPDHRNAGFILTDALVAARDPLFFTDQSLEPHRPHELLLWEADVPNHVEDVGGFAQIKIDALLAHRSQFASTMGIEGPRAEDRAWTLNDLEGPTVDKFRSRILAQLAEHGHPVDAMHGEIFHRMTEL
jgi:LmbE family N-acetylglucosaminyl deacetylase